MERRRAIFFDRDNTLNRDLEGYIGDWRKMQPMPHARSVVQSMRMAGYLLFLITNQSGVGRGFFPIEAVHACNRRLEELVGDGPVFAEVGISTGTAEAPDVYRKPSPRFVLEMCDRYGLMSERCWVVGDRETDLAMATRAGARGILVHGGEVVLGPEAEKACFGRFADLDSAWKFIRACDG